MATEETESSGSIKTIKCLSVKQPFASWLLDGTKNRELRSTRIKYRGPLVIHSSQVPDVEFIKQWGLNPDAFKNGCILGKVLLTGCVELGSKEFAWTTEVMRTFENPIPYKGSLGLWDLNSEVIENV